MAKMAATESAQRAIDKAAKLLNLRFSVANCQRSCGFSP